MTRSRIKRVLAASLPRRGYRSALVAGKALDIRRGAWTEPELALIAHAVKPGDTVLDIGANYGMWSYHLARKVGDDGHVVAFEPVPETAAALSEVLRVLRVRKRVDVINAGAGERSERVEFSIPRAAESGIPIAGLARISTDEQGSRFVKVAAELVPIDNVVLALELDPAFIKCDVEGAELFALRGAAATLTASAPTVVCEVGRGLLRERYGIEAHDLLAYMGGLGYEAFRFEAGRLRSEDFAGGHDGNYVFVHPRNASRLAGLLDR